MLLARVERDELRDVGVEALEVIELEGAVVPESHRHVIEAAAARPAALVAVVDFGEERGVQVAGLFEQTGSVGV